MLSPETLRGSSLFAGMDPAFFDEIAMLGDEVEYLEGEWLFREGHKADAVFLLIEGSVELKINFDEAGERQQDLTTLVTGNFLGFSALLEPYVYTLSAAATTKTRAAKIDAAGLRKLMENNPAIGYRLMSGLASVIAERLTNLRMQFVSMV